METTSIVIALVAVLLSTLTFLAGLRRDSRTASTEYVQTLERRLTREAEDRARVERDCKERIAALERKVEKWKDRTEELEAENVQLLKQLVRRDGA